jgi:hypothetical protein
LFPAADVPDLRHWRFRLYDLKTDQEKIQVRTSFRREMCDLFEKVYDARPKDTAGK